MIFVLIQKKHSILLVHRYKLAVRTVAKSICFFSIFKISFEKLAIIIDSLSFSFDFSIFEDSFIGSVT